jgi:hypothetical protein
MSNGEYNSRSHNAETIVCYPVTFNETLLGVYSECESVHKV